MSDFDLTPPSLPNKKQEGGIFKRLFKKPKEELPPAPAPQAPAPANPVPAEGQVDIDEIKRKLGLDEELPPVVTQPVPPAPEKPAASSKPDLKIDDWAQDSTAPKREQPRSEWLQEATVDHGPTAKEHDWTAHHDDALTLPAHDDGHDTSLGSHEEGGLHHELVDQHLAPVERKQVALQETIEQAAQETPVPEWKLQEKEVTPDRYFILRNGLPVKSLRELIEVLEYIDESTFDHHVNEYRNDFANWVRDVIGNADLSAALQQATDKQSAVAILREHEADVRKRIQAEHQEIKQVVKKREQTLQKLSTIDEQVQTLQKQLDTKTKELMGERKRIAQLIKDKLDAEVKRRLQKEKEAMTKARTDLAKAKQEYLAKIAENDKLTKDLAGREKAIMLRESRSQSLLDEAKAEQLKLAEEKKTAAQLLKDASQLTRQWEEMKKLDVQNKRMAEEFKKREADIARREDAIKAREAKITMDLTRAQSEQEKLVGLREEHAKREAAVKQMEAEARKSRDESEARLKEAVVAEREMSAKLKADVKKLETLRSQIEKTLSRVLGEKKSVMTAVELRKKLEAAIMQTKQDVVQERKRMEDDAYKTLIESKITTTPIGQPAAPAQDFTPSDKQVGIYAKIEECRQAIERKELERAKHLYMQLREEFGKVKVDAQERSSLYNNIRELYDDIHLMMLG